MILSESETLLPAKPLLRDALSCMNEFRVAKEDVARGKLKHQS